MIGFFWFVFFGGRAPEGSGCGSGRVEKDASARDKRFFFEFERCAQRERSSASARHGALSELHCLRKIMNRRRSEETCAAQEKARCHVRRVIGQRVACHSRDLAQSRPLACVCGGKVTGRDVVPRMMTVVVPSPTSSSCVLLSSIMDCRYKTPLISHERFNGIAHAR
jgi:hypothetical protein